MGVHLPGDRGRGFEVILAHPFKVRAIAEARVKTDKVDAETLAHLLRANLVPRSHVPSRDIRDLRELVRQRSYLVRRATSFKNRIHSELRRCGIRRPKELTTPFSHKSIDWMRSLDILAVSSNLDRLERILEQVDRINSRLLEEFNSRHEAQLIATVPASGSTVPC
jgi:transposase